MNATTNETLHAVPYDASASIPADVLDAIAEALEDGAQS